MTDRLTSSQRHNNMAAIKGKDTKPEMVVRKFLWSRGFRYRLNHPRLPGKPDVVLRKYRTCVFVNGCFWHGHRLLSAINYNDKLKIDNSSIENSECCKIPQSNHEFWVRKILRNKERDIDVQHKLAEMGWHCITIWECELRPKIREQSLERLAYTLNKIFLQDHGMTKHNAAPSHSTVSYSLPENDEVGMAAEETF